MLIKTRRPECQNALRYSARNTGRVSRASVSSNGSRGTKNHLAKKAMSQNSHRYGIQPMRGSAGSRRLCSASNDLPTAPKELSIFTTEGYYRGDACRLRRFTVRVDGFVSPNAPLKGGELITRPFTFEGGALSLNAATSAAGSVRVEIQDGDGKALKGYTLRDCDEIYGDYLDRMVTWKGLADVSGLAGKSVRLRFALSDADLYSLQFTPLPV